ncbi:hypothetical protein SAMN05192551_101151 [Tindallia magadiensis]|uniref:Uncharacterized protein n=1 Tax=Tindallia magadiensis TaxID=69895 RepID=A0A1I3ADM7_9FIRM|nr:hypothetical protein [Tindallia magadiensis]SFH48184.1 hypothetical protein SAMN05192551_101151 [Tindallia magadiensis]
MTKYNSKGYISIICLLIGSSVIALSLSIMSLHVNDYYLQQSSFHRVKAQYLAESAFILTMHNLFLWSEDAINTYIDMANDKNKTAPLLEVHLEKHFIQKLSSMENEISKQMKEAFSEYEHEHGFDVSISVSTDRKTLIINVHGYYENARVFLEGRAKMPLIVNEHHKSEEGLDVMIIQALYLESLVQGYPKI